MTDPGRRRHIVLTAGGTVEPIDDVRAVTNASTGRLGLALARSLAWRGHRVTLLAGPAALARASALPPSITQVPFKDHLSLWNALEEALRSQPDAVLMAAAVADYAPVTRQGKIRSTASSLSIEMQRTPKLLDRLRDLAPQALLVGFKLLSGVPADELVEVAQAQNRRARLDATVANDLRNLHGDQHPVLWVDQEGATPLVGQRDQVAEALARRIVGPDERPPDDHPGQLMNDLPAHGRARRWWHLGGAMTHTPPDALPVVPASLPSLLASEPPPHEPLALRSPQGVLLGQAPADAWDNARRWASLRGPGRGPLLHRGRVAGALEDDGHLATLHAPSSPDRAAWIFQLLPRLKGRNWVLPDDLPAPELGFIPHPQGPAHTWLAPWDRSDHAPAASAVLAHAPSRQVLIGQRHHAPHQGAWAFPGGKTGPGESSEQAAARELHEETGVVAPGQGSRRWVSWNGTAPTWEIHSHLWWVLHPQVPRPTPSFSAQWMSVEDALRVTTLPGVRRILHELDEHWTRLR